MNPQFINGILKRIGAAGYEKALHTVFGITDIPSSEAVQIFT